MSELVFRGRLDADANLTALPVHRKTRKRMTVAALGYDEETDTTTAVLREVSALEFSDYVAPLRAQQLERERIRALFSG